jgi:hypothetical protein
VEVVPARVHVQVVLALARVVDGSLLGAR